MKALRRLPKNQYLFYCLLFDRPPRMPVVARLRRLKYLSKVYQGEYAKKIVVKKVFTPLRAQPDELQ